MPLSPGSRLGAYEIAAPLGQGGMGEVYRAHDARLGRDVALKVLHADVARDPVRLERFTREARAVAALNHPHIVTIYSIEDVDGVPFMTMEIVEGQTLDTAIASSGLALKRFLELAVPIADALTAAHQKQITHRDLKPGNVMVTGDGRVKVLDFGLARVGDTVPPEETMAPTRAALTHEGTIVGTMPYMSPEQVEGRSLDARTDLFSLGVMFYEMLAGSRPFAGGSSPALMSAILRDVPRPLDDLRADLPDALVRLIGRCLEKRPEDRIQTARDVYNELRHIQKQIESGMRVRSDSASAATEASLWIAVLPFTVRGADADADALALGLTEDITSGLSRFPALSVIAAQSARAFRDSTLDVRHVAERLGARYVLGGTVRKSSSSVRVAAHLVDARSGANLWSETYDRSLDVSGDLFAMQDDVTDRIVATVADKSGVLARSMVQAARQLPLAQLSARELIFRCWMFQWHPQPHVHAELRSALEDRLEVDRENPHLWAELANLYICEHSLFANPLPDPLGRSMRAARRAIEIDPGHQEGWKMVALTAFYEKDDGLLREASERVIRLNPRNSNALAWMGSLRIQAGDYDAGWELTARAMALNPSHPGWYHFAPFSRHFARGEFVDALKAARRVNMPEFMWMQFAIAAAAGRLGLGAEAAAAAERLVALAPAFADDGPLTEFVRRWYWPPELIESLLDGVRKARGGAASVGSNRPPSSSSRRLAVLAFTAPAEDADLRSLADGLTEDVTAGLSRFSYLSVMPAQHDAPTAARYRLDGRLRRMGTGLRATVRVLDASSGTQLWSETYDRQASSGDSLQDDLTDRIVATVGDSHGVLMRAMSQVVEHLAVETLEPGDLELRYWAYHRQHAPAEHGLLRDAFERSVEHRPGYAFGWAALAHLYCHEHGFMFNARPDPLGRARRAIARASELDPVDQHGWEALALTYFFQRDPEGFVHASERSMALNPRNANTLAWMGVLSAHTGDLDRGLALAQRAMVLNPDHPGWYHIAACNAHLERREYADALRAAKRINMPQHIWQHVLVAIAAGELGRASDASAGVEAVEALVPAMVDPAVVADATGRWKWDDGVVEQMMRGYRKALALRSQPSAPGRPPSSGDTRPAVPIEDASPRVAVLPFTARGGESATSLADGLTEDITTGLSRFAHLRVVPSGTAGALTLESAPHAGVRYLLEGRVQAGGNTIRVTARLIDSATGTHLWAETFDRAVAASMFDVQDDVASYIAATIGDTSGVLARSMAAAVMNRPVEELHVRELVLRFHAYVEHFDADEHARLRAGFERALEREPLVAEGWACLADLYEHEHAQRLNPLPDSLGRQRRAAQRALEIDPHNQRGWTAMAGVHTFERDRAALLAAAERAVSLNPLDADTVGLCALFLSCAGEDDRAMTLFERAVRLKPQHPGWYHFTAQTTYFKRQQYAEALTEAKRVALPRLPTFHLSAAAAAARAGSVSDAHTALEALRRLDPRFLQPEAARQAWRLWIWDEAVVQDLVDALGEAIALEGTRRPSSAGRSGSGSDDERAARGITIGVQPFTARGGEHATALAEGLVEDMTAGLARYAHLAVVGAEAAAYRIEGTVRLASGALRVIVRLLDAVTGTHVWTEQFDRPATGDLLTIQDDIANRTITTLADESGFLVAAEGNELRDRPAGELTASQLVLRFHLFAEQFQPEEHAVLRDAFETLLEREPRHATAWACLAILYAHEVILGLNPRSDAVARQRAAAERALALDSRDQAVWIALAMTSAFARDLGGLRVACERVVSLNPLSAHHVSTAAIFLVLAGDMDRGVELARRVSGITPHHQGWFNFPLFLDAYQRGAYEEALEMSRRIRMPVFSWSHLSGAAAAGQLGRAGEARASLEGLRTHHPRLLDPEAAREEWRAWLWHEEPVTHLIEGVEKALALTGVPRSDSGASSRAHAHAVAASDMRVAVLPFTARGGENASLLASGLTEDIVAALAKFPYVNVVSRGGADAGGARFVLEGSVTESGEALRVGVRLVDTNTSAHVWAETFDRSLSSGLFAVQDDLTGRVGATVADAHGVLSRLLGASLSTAALDGLSPAELVLRYDFAASRLTAADHAALRDALERAVVRDPHAAGAWAALAGLCSWEIFFGFNPKPEPHRRLREAAARAISLDPGVQRGWVMLAATALFDRDRAALESAADRALNVNPLHTQSAATIGLWLTFAGDPERGTALVQRAIELNPRHPGWYFVAPYLRAYARGEFQDALGFATRIAMPDFMAGHLAAASAAGQLGTIADARPALDALARFDASLIEPEGARAVWARWIWDASTVDALVDGLRKARALVDVAPPPQGRPR